MRVASIHLYPVKSLGGVGVERAGVEPWGLDGDRRWLVLDTDGTYLTAREEHRTLGITAAPRPGGGVRLTGLDGSTVDVDPPVDGPLAPSTISRLDAIRIASAEVHEWLSAQLGRELRLAWQDDPRQRSVSLDHGGRPGDPLSLADAGPLLVATLASMRQLNDWIAVGAVERGEDPPDPLPISRFRPNVVLDHDEPFAEDSWRSMRIGEIEFRFAEVCDRCVLTTIDHTTFTTGKEPIRTLARFRNWGGKTWFGVRVIPIGTGQIAVGDEVFAR